MLIEATDTLGFNADSDALIDVARFEAAVTEGRGPELGQDGAARLTDGVLLYRGDLLEGMYHDWVVRERERLLHLYLSALSRLVDWHRRTGDHDSALRYARLILDRDPLREDAHQAIIEIHGEAGRRTAALRQYEACRRLLADELGVDPLPETAAAAHAAARPDGEPRHGEDGVLSGRVEALTERLQKTQRELRDLTGALAQMLVELRELTGSVPATRR